MAGSNLNYTVTVSNAGPNTAENVMVSDTLPAGVVFGSTTGCDNDPGGVPTCNLGDIPAGGSDMFTITVAVSSVTVGTITNNASVTSDMTDPSPGNNSSTEDTLVLRPCGNGTLDPGEECDDGNSNDGDGCAANCDAEGACCSDGPNTESDCFLASRTICENSSPDPNPGGAPLYLGDGTVCGPSIDCVLLLVTYEKLEALATPGGVLIRWTTIDEVDTIGFRVLRETTSDRVEKTLDIVAAMVPAAGHGLQGATYEILDDSKASANAVHYYIEDIDNYGKVTRHGTIVVQRGAGAREVRGTRAVKDVKP